MPRSPDFSLPVPRQHPLPSTLAAWSDRSGDYFDQIQPVSVGYLIWSKFPVSVYIEPATTTEIATPFTRQRAETWIRAVTQAVQEWQAYLPLQVEAAAEAADIKVLRSPPPLKLAPAPSATGADRPDRPGLVLGRARSAETRFELYLHPGSDNSSYLSHRVTIQLRPDQAETYLKAAARHELGHALGIWGHSPLQTDALYFSQVRNPPTISPRDVNTLKRVYEQPTRLGWPVSARE